MFFNDIDVLRTWVRVVLIVAGVCSTTLPVLYSFSPWRQRALGRLFMSLAISFAAVIDLWATLQLWKLSLLMHYYFDVVVLTAVAISTVRLTYYMWRVNWPKQKEDLNEDQANQ